MAEAGQYTFRLNSTNNEAESVSSGAVPQSRNASINFSSNGFTGGRESGSNGQTPKRRGPKPDAKPAATRRQAFNRVAQRTHRDRKANYVKSLEQEIYGLKEEISTVSRERDKFVKENRRLREVLESYGITPPIEPISNTPTSGDNMSEHMSESHATGTNLLDSSSTAMSGSHATGTNQSDSSSAAMFSLTDHSVPGPVHSSHARRHIDYGQSGIDFVLALERPCMDHMQMLCVKSQGTQDICGHALMATCPPRSHLIDYPNLEYPHQMDPSLNSHSLMRLLDLSEHLPLDGEITPVMAWAAMRRHARFFDLSQEDLDTITANLLARVRCYGFGAVLEEFEVQDAVAYVFDARVRRSARSIC